MEGQLVWAVVATLFLIVASTTYLRCHVSLMTGGVHTSSSVQGGEECQTAYGIITSSGLFPTSKLVLRNRVPLHASHPAVSPPGIVCRALRRAVSDIDILWFGFHLARSLGKFNDSE